MGKARLSRLNLVSWAFSTGYELRATHLPQFQISRISFSALTLAATSSGRFLPQPGAVVELDILLGPRTDWFTPAAVELLCRQEWTVTPQSNRVGIRLAGDTPLERAVARELPSEGTALGAIQVPASGQPVLFLADHPLMQFGAPPPGPRGADPGERAGAVPGAGRVRAHHRTHRCVTANPHP